MRALIAISFLCVSLAATAASNFTFDESPGPFGVGFHVVQQYDYSRAYLGKFDTVTGRPIKRERARPIQTLIWYPAQKGHRPMRYADYLDLSGSEDDFTRTPDEQAAAVAEGMNWFVPAKMSAEQVTWEKAQVMWAVKDAVLLAQRFPVVIYAPSFNASAFENADLCEYLASHGYVVIASPSFGAHSRAMTDDLEGVEAQVDDIEFLIGYVQSLPYADTSRIAVAGYSWGGVANVFAAAKDDRITALVGLDGGIRYVGKLIAEAKYVVPQRLTAPYLYLRSPAPTPEEIAERKTDVSDDLPARMKYSDIYDVTFASLVHYHFASEHLRFLDTGDKAVFPGTYSLTDISRAYGLVARYTLNFLDAELKNDIQAREFVKRVPRGISDKRVRIEVRPSTGSPPTRDAMAAELDKRGFASATAVYEEMKAKDERFTLPPFDLMTWIGKLKDRPKDAVEIGTLFVKLYPAMPGAYVWLAEAQRAAGEKPAAIETYKKAQQLAPANTGIAKALEKLQSGGM